MRYKNAIIVFAAVFICFVLFTSVSIYSLTNMAQENTREINTMLTYRIYDEISTGINEPITVSRAMSCDEFLIKAVKEEATLSNEDAVNLMKPYLEKIKEEYGYDTAFVISDKTRRYFTYEGLNKIVDVDNDAHDIWYKNFIATNEKYVIDVDVDEVNEIQWTLFMDFRLEDENGELLGVCGVGTRMYNIQEVFSETQKNHNVIINFVDKDGLVQIDTHDKNIENDHFDMSAVDPSDDGITIHISDDGSELTVFKFIEPLNWYLVVRSSTSDINKNFSNTISVNIIISLIITVIVLSILTIIIWLSQKRNALAERMSKQLAATADIYISMHEINFLDDTFTEVRNKKSEASEMIGETRNHCQEMIRTIMTTFSDESSRKAVLDFVDFSTLNSRLKNRNTITIEWLSADKKWRRSRYIVSDRTPTGIVARAMYLIEDINEERLQRDRMLTTTQQLGFQIRSIANIYTSVHDVDIIHDSFVSINTTDSVVENIIGKDINNAQQVLIHAMDQLTDESCKQDVMEFINFKNVEKNLTNSNSVAIEFLSSRGYWSRGRFIVSERTEDGKLSHVIWAVENIDAEKRQRDNLTAAAETLNDRISSIANIYMTVHELDIRNDTFTEVKSQLDYVHDLIGETRTHAQETILKVMDSITDESCVDDVRRFIDLSTLGKRMRKTDTITIEYMNKDKLWRRGRFVASRRDAKGRLVRVMWLSEDINDEKMERDKLLDMSQRAIAASEAKSSFLSNMSHEIRTPINAVLGMNEMILRESDDKNVLAYSESIRTAGNTLLGIVNDILDFSKIEAGKMEIIPVNYDLSSVINDLVNMIQTRADDKGLQLILEISPDIPNFLHGDEVRIKQVITNILTNAVKYTEKGQVTFTIDYEKLYGEPDSIMLNVSVKDTGIGIKKEDMKKLFTEFDRIDEERNRKVEGTGLGMSITQRLLQMMDSSLQVESIYELGSRFSFSLKQTVVKWEALGDYEASYKASLGKRKKYREKFRAPDAQVLIVDDTPMNLTVFKNLLKQTEIKIDLANSGNEGLALTLRKKYDLIFLDHMMPEKDGIETLHELRSRPNDPNKDTPAVCLTANAISGAREQYLSAGFDNYLTKPIDSSKLEELLLEYLPKEKILDPGDGSVKTTGTTEPEYTVTEDGYDSFFDDEPVLPGFLSDIDEIDTEAGIVNCGSVEGYISALRTYSGMINDHATDTEKFWQAGDLPNATIKIHAMKSTSRIIGALSIGDLAQDLEIAGKAGDAEKVAAHIHELLERCRNLGEKLKPLSDSETDTADDTDKPLISPEELKEAYALIKESVESYNFENIDEISESLKDYRIPDEEKERVNKIIKAVSEFDYDKLPEILS